VGDMCSGAKVNNKNVPIRYELQNGDKVEIITSKTQKPKLDWLNFVVTNKAKSKIKRSIKEEKYQEAELGKEILRRKLRNRKIQFTDSVIDKLIKQYKLKSSIDLYYLIAIEKIDVGDIKKTLEQDELPEQAHEQEKEQKVLKPVVSGNDDAMVIGDDIGNLNYELAKCCNPISGDAVFGFVTVGKGITIHRINCPNAAQLLSKYNYRVIDVKWRKTDESKTYLTTLRVTGEDRMGILSNITQIISNDLKVNMVSLNVESKGDRRFDGRFKLRVKDTGHLNTLIHKILKVNGVEKAVRLNSETTES
jgi:GTP pyrophosphokinase